MVLTLNKEYSENHKRQPKPPAPEGGISLGAAARKYKIPNQTISRWVKRGLISFILETRNEKYINEAEFAELAKRYKQNPGQGKWTIRQAFLSR